MKLLQELIEAAGRRSGQMESPPKGYEIGRVIQGKQLVSGMKVAASYNQYNHGTDFVKILGVTGNDQQYGEGGVKYNSVKAALQANGVKSLKQLEEKDNENEYGYGHFLCAEDIPTEETGAEPDRGCWYYIFEGRWTRGSGAEKLSFRELIPASAETGQFQEGDAVKTVNGVPATVVKVNRNIVQIRTRDGRVATVTRDKITKV